MSRVHSDNVHSVDKKVVNELDIASAVGNCSYNLSEFFHIVNWLRTEI